MTITLSPTDRLARATALLRIAVRELTRLGINIRQAKSRVRAAEQHRHGRRMPRHFDAMWNAVECLKDLRALREQQRSGDLEPLVYDDEIPF